MSILELIRNLNFAVEQEGTMPLRVGNVTTENSQEERHTLG